jgi:hypothetical protein
VRVGLERDAEVLADDSRALTGPAAWLVVWRAAEDLIRVQLWPAVYAVAWELAASPHALTFADVAEVSAIALEQAS